MIIAKFAMVVIGSYLLGSVPFGVLIGKRIAKVDVRDYGSGKMGGTNVLRVAGKKAAALVVVLDILKGALAVLFASLIFRGDYSVVVSSPLTDSGLWSYRTPDWWMIRTAPVVCALAAMAGHNWPVFLKFRGGRGVATFFGGLVALCPAAALLSGEITVLGAGLTRFASLGSIAGAVVAYATLVPLTIFDGFPIELLAYALIGTIIIIVMHRSNIARLLAGKERKLGEKVEIESPQSKERV